MILLGVLSLAWVGLSDYRPCVACSVVYNVDPESEPGPCKDENGDPWNVNPAEFGAKSCDYWMDMGLKCDSVWEDTCSEDHPGGSMYNSATLGDNPQCEALCPGEMCLSMTYGIAMKKADSSPQPMCKGKIGFKCSGKDATCTHEKCRKKCSESSKCSHYYFGEGSRTECFNFQYCQMGTRKKTTKSTGHTYAKVCNDYAGTVAISWGDFAGQERWATDQEYIRRAVEGHGGMLVAMDAGGDVDKQKSDIQSFIDLDMDVIIVLAVDATQLDSVIENAMLKKIPVIGYDRLIDREDVYYITFDNVEVGRLQAQAVLDEAPKGEYAMIKGDEQDPNADFVRQGQQEVLAKAISKGRITIVYDEFHAGWNPANVEVEFKKALDANPGLDAVVSSNDGMAGAAAKVMAMEGINLPLSGQDGDKAALNRVAKGTQTVSVWKDSRMLGKSAGELAVQLAKHTNGFQIFKQHCSELDFEFTTPSGKNVLGMLLKPVAITQDNLDVVIDANWITVEELCMGVEDDAGGACA